MSAAPLVSSRLDARVEDGGDHCVEQGNEFGEELGMDSRGHSVQDHECSIECGHHNQIRGPCGKALVLLVSEGILSTVTTI